MELGFSVIWQIQGTSGLRHPVLDPWTDVAKVLLPALAAKAAGSFLLSMDVAPSCPKASAASGRS